LAQKLEQRLVIKQALLMRRLDLTGAVHGGNYQPEAVCPQCDRSLTPFEIIKGFRSDPHDYTTCCTQCHYRFAPKLMWKDPVGSAELQFYCATQVLEQLLGLEKMTPDEIREKKPAVYHSVLVHHGNLRAAFQKISIQYQFENVTNWKEKIEDFLGKLPDTVIAKVVDVSVRSIRSLRKSLEIEPFSRRAILAEEE